MTKYNPAELATLHAFNANPFLIQNWYKWRRSIVSQANPNETPITQYTIFHLEGHSGIELPNLIDTVWPEFE